MARRADRQITLRDPKAIKALTHPARIAIIDDLYGGRVATATDLAALTGLTPNATGWHLRALEKLGIVERAPTTGDGRSHPWRAAGAGVAIDAKLPTRAQRGAAALLTGAAVDALRRELIAYGAAETGLPDEWQAKGNFDTGTVYLTPAETAELIEAMHAAVAPFRRRSRARSGTRRVRITAAIVPVVD
jgi:DNA-binding transcriptional ArsR family regulator